METIRHCEEEISLQWKKDPSFTKNSQQKKFYCLAMLPYTSGNLHPGHARTYFISDFIARLSTLQGKQVLHPIGWDAFGLPAENAALKKNLSPEEWTQQNIVSMKQELQKWGCLFNWDKELNTCSPDYYKHTQWLFLKMWEMGLVYRKSSYVYWDPIDKTVLANEQVIDGRGWRSNALLEKRKIPQWYLKVTQYQEELLTSLESLKEFWPGTLLNIQKNWIGKSEGYHVPYQVKLGKKYNSQIKTVTAFTTDLESVQHGTYMLSSANSSLGVFLSDNDLSVSSWIKRNIQVAAKHYKNKQDEVLDTGLIAINPVHGNEMPLLISNTVEEYGTGIVQCCPKVSPKDHAFAVKHNLPLEVTPKDTSWNFSYTKAAYYKLKDWCVSRQRTWGTPIPIIECNRCGFRPVSEDQLPITQQKQKSSITCTECGETAKFTSETLDTFFDSSWYYLRYVNPMSTKSIPGDVDDWMPVDYYVGGIEHATMHLLYARFANRVVRDLKLTSHSEPFKRIINQGMVTKDGAKMSKSRGNTVDTKELVDLHGIDCLRFFVLVSAPPQQTFEWDDKSFIGSYRFIKNCYKHFENLQCDSEKIETLDLQDYQDLGGKFGEQINIILDSCHKNALNNVASSCIKMMHLLKDISDETLLIKCSGIFLKCLHPICPHLTDYFWRKKGFGKNILESSYPQKYQQEKTSLSIKILRGNKLVGIVDVPNNSTQAKVIHAAQLKGIITNEDSLGKLIYVANKLLKIL